MPISRIEPLLAWLRASFRATRTPPAASKFANSVASRLFGERGFDNRSPTSRNSIDIFYGEWLSSLPSMEFPADCSANMAFYNDVRIHRFNEQIGGFSGKTVLELGPLEAGHSYLMEKFGAADIVAIEASTSAFLKCLIVKEILGVRARFLLGNFNHYLREATRSFDVVLACGVLYHQTDPLELIEGMARAANCICVWTHYYEDSLLSDPLQARKFGMEPTVKEFHGETIEFHEHYYFNAPAAARFTGGGQPNSFWLTRDGIGRAFRALGFSIMIIDVEADNPNGPAMTFVARRLPGAARSIA